MLERQREGIAKAKAEGKYKGRKPTVAVQADQIRAMRAAGEKPAHIARRLGVARSSVYRMLEGSVGTSGGVQAAASVGTAVCRAMGPNDQGYRQCGRAIVPPPSSTSATSRPTPGRPYGHAMIPLSVLDLSPIAEGSDAGRSLHNSLDLARHVEALGYRRYWMAEHHNLPGIASAATAVVLAHIAAGTSHIRIGAGGIMLPNHAPLLIAEQFGTLAALHPGRVDLGLGRAPGSDQVTARAMRRTLHSSGDDFPQDVVELMGYFQAAEPGQAVQAVPGVGLHVPIWIREHANLWGLFRPG